MKIALGLIGGVAAVALLVAVWTSSNNASASGVLVVGPAPDDMPEGCSPREIAQIAIELVEALNERDIETSDSLIARDPSGSIGEPEPDGELGFERFDSNLAGNELRISSRSALLEHVSQGRANREALRLVSIATSPWNPHVPNAGGAFFTALLNASDGRRAESRIIDGKMGINCASRTVFAWVVYGDAQQPSVCEPPEGWTVEDSVLACGYRT